ncbi:MAG: hypothetical protein QXJ21_09490 [Thermofilum sp.]
MRKGDPEELFRIVTSWLEEVARAALSRGYLSFSVTSSHFLPQTTPPLYRQLFHVVMSHINEVKVGDVTFVKLPPPPTRGRKIRYRFVREDKLGELER